MSAACGKSAQVRGYLIPRRAIVALVLGTVGCSVNPVQAAASTGRGELATGMPIARSLAPALAADDCVISGNPLWATPLRSISATRERPLFSPSRRRLLLRSPRPRPLRRRRASQRCHICRH